MSSKILGKKNIHQPDFVLVITLFLIVSAGLIMLASASIAISYEKFGDIYYLLKRQVIHGLIPGLILFFIFYKMNHQFLKKLSFLLLIFTIFLLIAVFIPGLGVSYGRAHRWVNIFGLSFQPAEIAKLTFLIYLCAWLEKKGREVKSFSQGLIPFLILLSIISFLIIFQPDLSTAVIIVLTSLAVFFVAGAKISHLLFLFLVGALGLYSLIKIAPYRLERIIVFLNPALDPKGIGYHIQQALLAIGSGGLFGRGLGQSRQKFLYLPEAVSDSIFAIIAEELGFILTLFFVSLFLLLALRGFKIAKNSSDSFRKLLACGITFWITFQALINISSMLGLVPLTGVTLPFVSAGGTSLAICLAAMGLLLNISKYSSV